MATKKARDSEGTFLTLDPDIDKLARLLSKAVSRLSYRKAREVVSRFVQHSSCTCSATFWGRVYASDTEDWLDAGMPDTKLTSLSAVLDIAKEVATYRALGATVVDDPSTAAFLLGKELMGRQYERCAATFLDIRHRVVRTAVLTEGTHAECLFDLRQLFGETLRVGAARLIIAHNHPSGDTTPSADDLAVTEQFLRCGQTLSIPVLDHLIFGANAYLSMRQATDLWLRFPQNEK